MLLQSKMFLLITLILLLPTLSVARAQSSPDATIGKGCTTAYCIDNDCDGYGVGYGYIKGPDADDYDPTVNTTASVDAKYGSIDNLSNLTSYMSARGYHWDNTVNNVYYISPTGDDSKGMMNDPFKPYKTYSTIKASISAGDLVLLRGGNHSSIDLTGTANGKKGSPVIIMSYPGELATITSSTAVSMTENEYFVIDNIRATGSQYQFHNYSIRHVTFRYLEGDGGSICHRMMVHEVPRTPNHDVTLEDSIMHSSGTSHAIYWGNRFAEPSTDLTLRGVIVYDGGGDEDTTAFQHNGPVTNLVIEDSIFHSNGANGPSLLNGAQDCIIRNNLFFNNNGHVFGLDNYTEFQSRNIQQITFINNTFWIGRYNNGNGSKNPQERACIMMVDRDDRKTYTFTGVIVRNNIFVQYGGEYSPGAILFMQDRHRAGTAFQNNIHYRYDGRSIIASSSDTGQKWTLSEFEASSVNVSDNYSGDPLFENVSVDYYDTPNRFDFDLTPQDGVPPSPPSGIRIVPE